MSQTITGVVADHLGAASRTERYRDTSNGILDGRRRVYWSCPSDKFRPTQPAGLPLEYGHYGERCGVVQHLELHAGRLYAVAETDPGWNLNRHGPFQFSYQLLESRDGLFDLEALAIVERSASICLGNLTVLDGNLHMSAYTTPNDGGFLYELLHNAEEAAYRRHSGPIEIRGAAVSAFKDATAPIGAVAPAGPVEYRSAAYDVAPGRREIVALVAPYESVTGVVIKGKPCREAFAVGAFDGVAAQQNVIRLNMNHRREEAIGKAVEFVTGRSEGLIASFRVSRTVAGDEALELAKDDVVDCSVGFAVVRESWPQQDLRIVHEGWLDHVALTATPAYGSAKVLGVRRNELLATP